jgi:cytochrome c
MIKEGHGKYSASIFFVLIILFALMVIKDQFAFDTSTKKQFAILASNYEDYQTKLKESMGVAAAPISGADIYNGKCIACHKFDTRLVGPAYNDVLPKYEGKKDELVKFVLNPVKVNPDFPAMPNQGLKPNEAEAVATYLLEHPSKK